jgi:hypothetical protein
VGTSRGGEKVSIKTITRLGFRLGPDASDDGIELVSGRAARLPGFSRLIANRILHSLRRADIDSARDVIAVAAPSALTSSGTAGDYEQRPTSQRLTGTRSGARRQTGAGET